MQGAYDSLPSLQIHVDADQFLYLNSTLEIDCEVQYRKEGNDSRDAELE